MQVPSVHATKPPVGSRHVNRQVLNGADSRTPVAIVVGPLPPPMMGPAVGTQMIRDAFELLGVEVLHVNTQDRRTVFNTGILDARNVALAVQHAAELAWKVARNRVALIYIPISQGRWGYARDAVLMAIGRALRKPMVVHLRGSNLQRFFRESTRVEQAIMRRTLGWPVFAIALTPGLANVYDGLTPSERVRVLENAIADPWPEGVERLIQERARRAGELPGALRILYVANDFATKGAETLVRALAQPGLGGASARLVGAPPPEVARETAALARDLGIGARVEIVGEALGADKWAHYEWADAFGYPTENDGQPLVILEAMAAALPIVASTYGGIPDTLQGTGMLVEPGDPVGLGEALRTLIDRPDERTRLGSVARRRFAAAYTPEAFQRRFADVFGRLVHEGGPPCAA